MAPQRMGDGNLKEGGKSSLVDWVSYTRNKVGGYYYSSPSARH